MPTPKIQSVGEGTVWRISDHKDESGGLLPPWKEIQVTNIFGFNDKPVVGEKVTVVPLDVEIASLDIKIVKTEKQDGCDEQAPVWWAVELEPIRGKAFFDVAPRPDRAPEYPFDVAVIYPAVRHARQIQRNKLTKSMLPRGVAINTVKAAVDLTNDGQPDVLIINYCCDDPGKPAEQCDYACGKTFKQAGKKWKLIDTSAPC